MYGFVAGSEDSAAAAANTRRQMIDYVFDISEGLETLSISNQGNESSKFSAEDTVLILTDSIRASHILTLSHLDWLWDTTARNDFRRFTLVQHELCLSNSGTLSRFEPMYFFAPWLTSDKRHSKVLTFHFRLRRAMPIRFWVYGCQRSKQIMEKERPDRRDPTPILFYDIRLESRIGS